MKNKMLKFIGQFIAKNGYAPTFREIAKGVGLSSTSTVTYHLCVLRNEGYINYKDSKQRTIVVLEKGRAVI